MKELKPKNLSIDMCIIAITGATGNMGLPTLKLFLEEWANNENFEIRLLLRESKKNVHFARKLAKYKNVKIFFASVEESEKMKVFVKDANFILHLAALIPPFSDYNEKETYETNFLGTKNLVDAIEKCGGLENCHFIHIGSVAQYGNRSPHHPFGRVGDPLMPSTFDVYAASKVEAERYVVESGLKKWVVLRQTGVLYDEILLKNMSDGLMFHTPIDCPIEWVTAYDSAILLREIVRMGLSSTLEAKDRERSFYRKIYNLGGGAKMRALGFETLNAGFRLMGSRLQDAFLPLWIAKRNFHCMWFLDSNILEEMFHFQKTSFKDFFSRLGKKYWYFKLAKPFLFLIKLFLIKPLLKNKNAPAYWKEKDATRYFVFCGKNRDDESWKGMRLYGIPIEEIEHSKELKKIKEGGIATFAKRLEHGYDESKSWEDLDFQDVKMAAVFRGGEVLSSKMEKGDWYGKLEWKCHRGHIFNASPYLVLKGGHWCPTCTKAPPWSFGKLSKDIPFYAQLYYDDHEECEDEVYDERPLSSI